MSHPSGDDHWTRRLPSRVLSGTTAPGAKLSRSQIAALCDEYRDRRPKQAWLAQKYGVSRLTVWRHLKAAGLVKA